MIFRNKSWSWKGNFHKKRIIAEDKKKMALIGEAWWQNANEEFEMLVLELQKVGRKLKNWCLNKVASIFSCKQWKKVVVCLSSLTPLFLQRILQMMVEDLSSLFNHVDIATSGSIVLTLQSHLVNTLSIPFVFVQCCKIQTSVVCVNKSCTQTGGQVGEFVKHMKIWKKILKICIFMNYTRIWW